MTRATAAAELEAAIRLSWKHITRPATDRLIHSIAASGGHSSYYHVLQH